MYSLFFLNVTTHKRLSYEIKLQIESPSDSNSILKFTAFTAQTSNKWGKINKSKLNHPNHQTRPALGSPHHQTLPPGLVPVQSSSVSGQKPPSSRQIHPWEDTLHSVLPFLLPSLMLFCHGDDLAPPRSFGGALMNFHFWGQPLMISVDFLVFWVSAAGWPGCCAHSWRREGVCRPGEVCYVVMVAMMLVMMTMTTTMMMIMVVAMTLIMMVVIILIRWWKLISKN